MESANFIDYREETNEDNNLNNEALIGWSSTCLDQTISFYVEYNCYEIYQDEKISD